MVSSFLRWVVLIAWRTYNQRFNLFCDISAKNAVTFILQNTYRMRISLPQCKHS